MSPDDLLCVIHGVEQTGRSGLGCSVFFARRTRKSSPERQRPSGYMERVGKRGCPDRDRILVENVAS